MRKTMKLLSLVLAVLMITIAFPTAVFATSTTIKLTTRAALLIDRSGSIKDQDKVNEILENIYQPQFDFVGYFDENQISLDPAYSGGGNSAICETVDEVSKLGYTHITVITDGQQWPKDYSSLGIYSDLDLTLILVGDKEEDSEELINNLKGRMINSNLKVVIPGSKQKVILNNYQAPVYEVQLPDNSSVTGNGSGDTTSDVDINNSNEDTFIKNIKKGYFPWWIIPLLLLGGALISAIFDFIHEIITKNNDKNGGETSKSKKYTAAVIPVKARNAISKGDLVLADKSGSMAKVQRGTYKACKKAKGRKKCIIFGAGVEKASLTKMRFTQAEGKTCGWEAVQMASEEGAKRIVLVSDLKFNGKTFDEADFSERFEKITVVAPSDYQESTVEELKEIADEVEVLPLQ